MADRAGVAEASRYLLHGCPVQASLGRGFSGGRTPAPVGKIPDVDYDAVLQALKFVLTTALRQIATTPATSFLR
jgi:hypothetical protein